MRQILASYMPKLLDEVIQQPSSVFIGKKNSTIAAKFNKHLKYRQKIEQNLWRMMTKNEYHSNVHNFLKIDNCLENTKTKKKKFNSKF